MSKLKKTNILDAIAKHNGYNNKDSLLYDYGLLPSVRTPKYKKRKFVSLLLKELKRRKKKL